MQTEQVMGLVLDGILAVLVFVSIFVGAHKGFASILLGFSAWIVAGVAAFCAMRMLTHLAWPLRALVALLLFGLCFGLLAWLASALSGKWKLPVLGKMNSFLGGLLGLVQGLASCVLFVLLFGLVTALADGQLPFFQQATADASFLLGRLVPFLTEQLASAF